jgi:hypothetical protein
LAVLLLLTPVQHSSPQDPVPVLFSLGSWDPAGKHVNTRLADRLSTAYPRLDQPDHGDSMAACV